MLSFGDKLNSKKVWIFDIPSKHNKQLQKLPLHCNELWVCAEKRSNNPSLFCWHHHLVCRSKCTAPNNTKLNGDTTMTTSTSHGNPYGTIQRQGGGTLRRNINNGFASLEQHPHNTLRWVNFRAFLLGTPMRLLDFYCVNAFIICRSMNGTLPRPDLHLLPNSETDPDSWSCSRSRETSPESSIPPGMPAFRVIPLTCESDAGSLDPFCNESPYVGLRGSEPPEWEPVEPVISRSGSAQPPATLLRKNQYWVCFLL